MKIREALENWKEDEHIAIIAIETLKVKGMKGRKLQDFCMKYGKMAKPEALELISKSG